MSRYQANSQSPSDADIEDNGNNLFHKFTRATHDNAYTQSEAVEPLKQRTREMARKTAAEQMK